MLGHTAKNRISSIQVHMMYSITVLNCEASQVETCIHHAWEACVWDRDGNKHLSIWPVKLFSPLPWHSFFGMKDKKILKTIVIIIQQQPVTCSFLKRHYCWVLKVLLANLFKSEKEIVMYAWHKSYYWFKLVDQYKLLNHRLATSTLSVSVSISNLKP